jgi:EAL and modified HD-GYP domain-containing signal transduction protein
MPEVFVGRQPIFDRQLNVVAYELLFRSSGTNWADITDGEYATSQVVHGAFMEIGLESLVGSKRAFVNLTRDFILHNYTVLFPTDRVVLEVLEDIEIDAELIAAVQALSRQGYTIALDDFVFHEHLRPLVEVADIIKVDVLALDRSALRRNVDRLSQYNVKLLAEKVETHDDLACCQDLGFDYFQGYFLCEPDIVTGHQSPANRLAVLRLLAKLQEAEPTIDQLEAIIRQDVSLSVKLLRLVNADPSLPYQIDSIHQVLRHLGTKFITAWGGLMMLADIGDKPHELMVTALIRGRMCELLADANHLPNRERFFMVGLFSVLDAMLDSPMAEIVASLPLTEDLVRALLTYEGVLGQTLRSVLAYERGNWAAGHELGLDHWVVGEAYLQALVWASAVGDQLTST